MAVNRDGTRHVAALARERGAAMVYVGTDYVFDGTKGAPYVESDPTNPASVYGKTKLAGETAALESGAAVVVARTSWLFGSGGKNFVDTIADRLEKAVPLRVVNDQRGSPTYARDLAHGIELLLRRGATGSVHVTNSGDTTWHGFAVEIARYLGIEVEIAAIASDQLVQAAPRPRESILSGAKFRELTGESLPKWQDALHRYLAGRRARLGEVA